jgi:hypothetical protein
MGLMIDWQSRYQEWEGSVEELEGLISEVAKSLPVTTKETMPNVRLIRHYVSIGAVSRPERRGKDAVYSFRQVVECIAVRMLLADRWPLSKIAEMTGGASVQDLMKFIPLENNTPNVQRNSAQALVEKFSSQISPKSTARSPALREASNATHRELDLQSDLFAFGSKTGEPERLSIIRLQVAPWCHVDIEETALDRLTTEDTKRAGDMLHKLLRREKMKKGGRK